MCPRLEDYLSVQGAFPGLAIEAHRRVCRLDSKSDASHLALEGPNLSLYLTASFIGHIGAAFSQIASEGPQRRDGPT
jgi:hypothetical protein